MQQSMSTSTSTSRPATTLLRSPRKIETTPHDHHHPYSSLSSPSSPSPSITTETTSASVVSPPSSPRDETSRGTGEGEGGAGQWWNMDRTNSNTNTNTKIRRIPSVQSPKDASSSSSSSPPLPSSSSSSSRFVRNEMKRENVRSPQRELISKKTSNNKKKKRIKEQQQAKKVETLKENHNQETTRSFEHQGLPQRWVDSFCILGLSMPERRKIVKSFIDQESEQQEDHHQQQRSRRRRHLIPCTPSLLDRYPRPQDQQKDFEFPEHIASFCFPQQSGSGNTSQSGSGSGSGSCTAIAIQQQHHSDKQSGGNSVSKSKSNSAAYHNIPEPRLCTTVLTSSKGRRLYLSTLTVYERLQFSEIQNNNDEQEEEEDNNDSDNDKGHESKRIKTDHHWSDTPSISPSSKKYSFSDINNDIVIWIPKCIALLSHYPYFHAQTTILKELYYTVASGNSPVPFERYVAHIVDTIPMPSNGSATMGLKNDNNKTRPSEGGQEVGANVTTIVEWRSWITRGAGLEVKFQLSPPWTQLNSRPVTKSGRGSVSTISSQYRNVLKHKPFNVSLEALFRTLSLSNILVLWATLLHEGKVVLSCHPNNAALLTPIAEALLDLLFPFQWQSLYIPLLPAMGNEDEGNSEGLIDLLDAPVPFLVGVTTTDLSKLNQPPGVLWCDLDHDVLHLGFNEDGRFVESIPVLPRKEAMRLKVELEEVADPLYLPSVEGIKGQMTTGDRSVVLENAQRETYALRTRLFDENHPPAQAFSRAYILSQANLVPKGKMLESKDFLVAYDLEIKKGSSFCCYSISENLEEEKSVDGTLADDRPVPELVNIPTSPLKDFATSLTRSSRNLQTNTDRFLAVLGQKDYATPSVWASKASTDMDFTRDALKRQDEIAAQFFQLADNEHLLTDRVRSSFASFLKSVFSLYESESEKKTDRLDVGRYVRNMGVSNEQHEFMKTVTKTQMFDVFIQNDESRGWFQNSVSHKSALTQTRENAATVSFLSAPSVCAAGTRREETFCQDRRFPDELNAAELLVEKELETPQTLWSTFLDSVLICCNGSFPMSE